MLAFRRGDVLRIQPEEGITWDQKTAATIAALGDAPLLVRKIGAVERSHKFFVRAMIGKTKSNPNGKIVTLFFESVEELNNSFELCGDTLDTRNSRMFNAIQREELPIHRRAAWDKLVGCATSHPAIYDFSTYNEIIRKLTTKSGFHLARYNDGEWMVMLEIPPYFLKFMAANGHSVPEVRYIAQEMLKIIKSEPAYYIGIDSHTRALKGFIKNVRNEYSAMIEPIPNIIYGDVFNAGTLWYGIESLVEPLSKRHTLTVGPDYMRNLRISKQHIETPRANCWRARTSIEKLIRSHINVYLSAEPVIVYSCSFLAKVLIDQFYHEYGDKITQIDIGSCIDPWCGIRSRPWHDSIVGYVRGSYTDYKNDASYGNKPYSGPQQLGSP